MFTQLSCRASACRQSRLAAYFSHFIPRRRLPLHRKYAVSVSPKPPIFGQPLATTHEHLMASHELTPGIPKSEYELRRTRLMDSLPPRSLVVCMGGKLKYMSQEIFYKFRQSSDMWYLTGFQEPDAALILEKTPTTSGRSYKMTMFCGGKNPDREQWDGARTGLDDVVSIFGADEACEISSFCKHLKAIIPLYDFVYVSSMPVRRRRASRLGLSYLSHLATKPSREMQDDYESLIDDLPNGKARDLAQEVSRFRIIKSPSEQLVMRRAADVSGAAHAKSMRFANSHPNLPEASLAAHFEYLCSLAGAERLAYVPVVASGANALVIHYTSNDNIVREGELVLIDAGCELNGYASDITRTYPTFPSGRFTTPQAEIYSAVLATVKYCTALCTESSGLSLYNLHMESCRVLTEELNRIGFNLRGSEIERVLYPHFLSHPVGIDLHERGVDRSKPIKNGMVITIEPGIYVPPTPVFPPQFHNIGIRIEDEVLVQKNHAVVLTVHAPKEIADVESTCQGALDIGPY